MREDPFTDERLEELLSRVEALENFDTWLDRDPSVAWSSEPEESWHGAISEVYESAGWEKCYHRDGARFHYDVKLRSNEAWRGFQDAIQEANVGDEDRLRELAQGIEESELEYFWLDDLPYNFLYEYGGHHYRKTHKVYQCGRQGGYANCSTLEKDPEAFIRLAQFLARAHNAYDSEEHARGIVEMALDQYREEKTQELASPRIERIEA